MIRRREFFSLFGGAAAAWPVGLREKRRGPTDCRHAIRGRSIAGSGYAADTKMKRAPAGSVFQPRPQSMRNAASSEWRQTRVCLPLLNPYERARREGERRCLGCTVAQDYQPRRYARRFFTPAIL